ncbi:hypothetical protein PIROE2DRAFT_14891 [Piromyces sp. E2]|nr:hypothetical protein PIROE2DRAFT_14891 [Piromyces sp. E2]|eukprot:OUM59533.1 hypothetical protein PIROE2DRAFT_14891 [Piromyces sp. E2]
MKLLQFATALFVVLLGIVQVSAKGYNCAKHVVIEHGDICYYIAGYNDKKDYYVRMKDLKIYNPTLDCDNLRSGQKLCVESTEGKQPAYSKYTIRKGDTCKSVAKKLKATVRILQNINNYLDCSRSNLNQQIGVSISYRSDGKYDPNFKNSHKVDIIKVD